MLANQCHMMIPGGWLTARVLHRLVPDAQCMLEQDSSVLGLTPMGAHACWEDSMATARKRLRDNEAGHAVKMARIRACNMALFFFSMPVSSFVLFATVRTAALLMPMTTLTQGLSAAAVA